MINSDRARASTSSGLIAVGVVHAVVFVGGAWVALATSGQFFAGPYEAAPFFPVLAVIAIGAIRAAAGAAGARAILVVGDLGLAGLLGSAAVLTGDTFRALSAAWYLGPAAVALAGGALALIALPPPRAGRIGRAPRDRVLLAGLVLADVVVAIWTAISNADAARIDVPRYLFQLLATTAPFDLAVFGAWWYGARWPLGLTGVAGLVLGIGYAPNYGADPVRWMAAFGPYALAVLAGARGPVLEDVPTRARAPIGAQDVGRSRPADIWIALGAIAYPFLGLWGHFPIVLDACLECGPRFPGDTVVWWLGVMTLVVVPIAALVALLSGARADSGRPFLTVLVASAAVVVFELFAGQAGVARFAFLGFAAPAILLVGLGAAVGLRRPSWLANAGAVAALAAAGLLWAWTWGIRASFGGGSAGEFLFTVLAYAMAAFAALAIARESSRVRPIDRPADDASAPAPALELA